MNVKALKDIAVICVDDEPDALGQMHLALHSFCKSTICVGSAEKALEMIEAEPPDIVVTDVRMAHMSGIELLEAVRSRYPEIAVVIVSAHSEVEYLLAAIRLKADGYLMKPINLYELLEQLSKIAEQKMVKTELDQKNLLLRLLNTIGGKRVQIIEYIFSKLDKDLVFYGTYDEIAAALNASKPTVVSAFQSLIENGVLVRIKNGAYKLNTEMSSLAEGLDYLE
ncbi:response regulator [Trichlorobacter ammonificans]|uniref:Histidine kinase n=1 Tax=Trichlorobacter ammonificans TaxID=2916410 RepID=A0ABN8HK96_9BACT|nr:response regulator [Trichlorobacter ammonificans]CAH2031753.1 Histidine kinase [Trichlorobacter ammonificans]